MRKGNVLVALLVIFALVGVNAVVWYGFFQSKSLPSPTPIPPPESTPSSALRFEVGEASPTPTAASAEDEAALIAAVKAKVSADTGTPADQLKVTVSQNTGLHAKGNVKEEEAVGGGYWLAAKSGSAGWVVVYHGQSQPRCTDVNAYDFPTRMVPECLNSSGNVITR